MTSMIEKVARKILGATFPDLRADDVEEIWRESQEERELALNLARIAIGSLREPTMRMCGEGDALLPLKPSSQVPAAATIYRAMIDAALRGE